VAARAVVVLPEVRVKNKLRLIGALLEKKLIESKPNLKKFVNNEKLNAKRGTAPTCLMQQSWATQTLVNLLC
jgi:hypothetical protein